MKITDCLDHTYTGQHRTISLEITRTVGELLSKAEESDHWHDLPDANRETVAQLLGFHCDYIWTSATA